MYLIIAFAVAGLLTGMAVSQGDLFMSALTTPLVCAFGFLAAVMIGNIGSSADYRLSQRSSLVAFENADRRVRVFVEGNGNPSQGLTYAFAYRDTHGVLRYKTISRSQVILSANKNGSATVECFKDAHRGFSRWGLAFGDPEFCKLSVPDGSVEERAQIPEA